MKNMASPYDSVCTVAVSLPGDTKDRLQGTSSAILIDSKHGYVVTHASILYQLANELVPGKLDALKKDGSISGPFFKRKAEVEVILPHPNSESVLLENNLEKDLSSHIQPSLLNGNSQNVQSYFKCRASMKKVFECSNLRQIIEKTLPSDTWQFHDDSANESSETENKNLQMQKLDAEITNFQLLPCFVLFVLKEFQPSKQQLMIRSSNFNRQGDPVEICATPFGGLSPEVFLNSRSRGIISNLAGSKGVLIMTDARCVPGCEGGALIYCGNGQRQLTGMMIASLCWKNSEWVGLSLACAMSELMGSLQGHLSLDNDLQATVPGYFSVYARSNMAAELAHWVGYVNVGYNWGSAVCVDPERGIHLTCSHVLTGMGSLGVTMSHHGDGERRPCHVIFKTPQPSHFDLAVIKCPVVRESKQFPGKLGFGKAKEGDVVYVVGHALFASSHNLAPTITRGMVSKVIRINNIPIMLQTTCAVHAGASGGGVFNTKGQLVGIVVCNSKDILSGAGFPHINMCIPMETITPVIRTFIKTQDESVLHSLCIQNKRIKRLWSIGTESETTSRL